MRWEGWGYVKLLHTPTPPTVSPPDLRSVGGESGVGVVIDRRRSGGELGGWG